MLSPSEYSDMDEDDNVPFPETAGLPLVTLIRSRFRLEQERSIRDLVCFGGTSAAASGVYCLLKSGVLSKYAIVAAFALGLLLGICFRPGSYWKAILSITVVFAVVCLGQLVEPLMHQSSILVPTQESRLWIHFYLAHFFVSEMNWSIGCLWVIKDEIELQKPRSLLLAVKSLWKLCTANFVYFLLEGIVAIAGDLIMGILRGRLDFSTNTHTLGLLVDFLCLTLIRQPLRLLLVRIQPSISSYMGKWWHRWGT